MLAGCLFPSFDELKKSGAAAGDDDDTTDSKDAGTKSASSSSGATSSGGSSSGTTSSSGSASSSSSSSGDAAPQARTITCGGITCSGGQLCCKDFIGDPSCKPASPKPDCDSLIVCDGAEDCGTGRCCQNGTGGTDSVCKPKCDSNEYTYCHVDAECPGGEKCTGTNVAAGPASSLGLKFCE